MDECPILPCMRCGDAYEVHPWEDNPEKCLACLDKWALLERDGHPWEKRRFHRYLRGRHQHPTWKWLQAWDAKQCQTPVENGTGGET